MCFVRSIVCRPAVQKSAGAIGFVAGGGLGPQFDGDLFMAGARDFLEGGHLFHFNLTGNRQTVGVADPRLEDRVADNVRKWEITESESLLIGRRFGVGTDIQTGPNGHLFIVSLSHGTICEIFRTNGPHADASRGRQAADIIGLLTSGSAAFDPSRASDRTQRVASRYPFA